MQPEAESIAQKIEGVFFQPLQVIPTPAGAVLHGLRQEYRLAPDFTAGFGEIYFSEVLPGHVKGWKNHRAQSQLFMVPAGQIKIVLYDARPQSATNGVLDSVVMGRPDHYGLLKIPNGIWYSFGALHDRAALLCNYADMPHDPAEAMTLPLATESIPYKWEPASLNKGGA